MRKRKYPPEKNANGAPFAFFYRFSSLFSLLSSLRKKPAEAGFFSISSGLFKFDIREVRALPDPVVADGRVDEAGILIQRDP